MQRPILVSTALILSAWAGVARADFVQDAVFHGNITMWTVRQPQLDQANIFYPTSNRSDSISNAGSLMDDLLSTTSWGCDVYYGTIGCTDGGTSQAIAQIQLTGGKTPAIDLLGSATRAYTSASANIAYFFRLDKLAADAPDSYVAITLTGSGSLAVDPVNPDLDLDSWVQAAISYQGPTDGSLVPFLTKYLDADSGSASTEFNYYEQRWLLPGKMSQVYMKVIGGVGGEFTAGFFHGGGEFQAVLDPTVEIAPWSSVEYHGQLVPADELYSLTFSPVLMPQTELPEPSLSVLTGMLLIVVVLAARWAKRRNRGSATGVQP